MRGVTITVRGYSPPVLSDAILPRDLRHFCRGCAWMVLSRLGRGDEAFGRRVHQADPDDDRSGHLLHGGGGDRAASAICASWDASGSRRCCILRWSPRSLCWSGFVVVKASSRAPASMSTRSNLDATAMQTVHQPREGTARGRLRDEHHSRHFGRARLPTARFCRCCCSRFCSGWRWRRWAQAAAACGGMRLHRRT